MNTNTRLLTQSNSRLAKADIIKLLADESAWSTLSSDQQQSLYALLPPPRDPFRLPLDHTVHPFRTEYAPYIKHFLHEWQNDLREGRNTQKWRRDAELASGERAAGLFDDMLAKDREDKWGVVPEGSKLGVWNVETGKRDGDAKSSDEPSSSANVEGGEAQDQLTRDEKEAENAGGTSELTSAMSETAMNETSSGGTVDLDDRMFIDEITIEAGKA